MDPVTMMIISALGSSFGLAKSAQQNKKNDKYLQGMVNANQSEYNKDYNTNYLDTEEAKAAIRTMLEQFRQVNSDSKSSAAITGASAEKQVALQGEMGKAFSGSLTNLAGKGTARKEMIKDRYLNRKGQLDSMVMNNMNNKSQNWDQFGSNAMQLGLTGLLANQGGAFDPSAVTGQSDWGSNGMGELMSIINKNKNLRDSKRVIDPALKGFDW
jgi:hypothetical protein